MLASSRGCPSPREIGSGLNPLFDEALALVGKPGSMDPALRAPRADLVAPDLLEHFVGEALDVEAIEDDAHGGLELESALESPSVPTRAPPPMQLRPALVPLFLCLASSACRSGGEQDHAHVAGGLHATGAKAEAKIEARSDSEISGLATFTEVEGGVLVEIAVHHAPPGWHAAHVHDKGDCSAPDASSAGGHFNPATKNHGSPHAPEHHAGDLGNLWVDAHGEGRHVILMPELTVADGDHSVRGRAVIVHAGVDDLVTQPTGNAGGRIGCGVIR